MLAKILTEIFSKAFLEAHPQLKNEEAPFVAEVVPSSHENFGHYQCNSAMRLAKIVLTSPRLIASSVVEKIMGDADYSLSPISKMEVAGPGFINITLKNSFLAKAVMKLVQEPHLGIPFSGENKKIVIDFSSPNVAKEMHVGHLRSTIIGDCLANLFEFFGYDVLRLNHIGDWGTAYGMLIAHLCDTAPAVLTGETETDLTHLVHWYRESKKRFDEDPEFKKKAQLQVVALQSGDPTSLKGWEIICSISQKAYREIYSLLKIEIADRGESFYNPFLPGIVADLTEKKLIEISDGAKCIFLEGFINREGNPLPFMLQKSDGGYNYSTTDMATIRHRIDVEKAERIIYVTDAGQSLHFQMLFKAAEKAGYLDRSIVRVDHVPFGLVLGGDGKKFRTRSGETERLIDLLLAAIKRAGEILKERNPGIDEKEADSVAKVLGIGALKYADLSCHRVSDYTFSYERMLRFEGNTAPYLLYSYVRIEGIKRKVNADIEELKCNSQIELHHPAEIDLSLHLCRFAETLDAMTEELAPNRLCDYLYELAEKFNAFFRDCRVEGTPEQNSRLLLCEATSKVLKTGLAILGIETLEKM